MGTRSVKDARDLKTGEKIYFKSHAKATYLSSGKSIEDAFNDGSIVEKEDLAGYLTKDAQELSPEEKTQVRSNLGMMYSTATSTTDYPSVTIK